jgi:hypothetical protein
MKKIFAIGLAALLLVAFTAPAMAKVDVKGIVFTDFYMYKQNAEHKSGGVAAGGVASDSSFTNTRIEVPGHTRLIGRWTNENGVGMFIEFGIGGAIGATGLSLRHAYGWWDVNPGFTLMVGHSTTPFAPLNPSQNLGFNSGGLHVIGLGFGNFYSGRFPQVRGTFKFSKNARLAIALVDPNGGGNLAGSLAASANPVDQDSTIPRIDIGAPLYFGAIKLYPSLFFQTKTYDDVAANSDDDVMIYGLSLGVNAGFGPMSITAEINAGQNWGNSYGNGAGLLGGFAAAAPYLDAAGNTKLEDTDCLAYFVSLGFKAGPGKLNLTYGALSLENEGSPTVTTDNLDVSRTMYGVQYPMPVAKTFIIRPEFFIYDHGDDNTWSGSAAKVDNGKETILGVEFQIVF